MIEKETVLNSIETSEKCSQERVTRFLTEESYIKSRVERIANDYIEITGFKQQEGAGAEWTFKDYEIEDDKFVIAQFSVHFYNPKRPSSWYEETGCCFPIHYLWAEDTIDQMREEKAQKEEKARLEGEIRKEKFRVEKEARDLQDYQRLRTQFESKEEK